MSEITPPRRRRRRSDADRSAGAILAAAKEVLGAQPTASVEDIAAAAGVSRQTVYAHFKTREDLIAAVVDVITGEAVAEMDAARLDEGSAADALLRLLDASWRTMQRYPLLLSVAAAARDSDHARHRPVVGHLDRLLTRGRLSGEFADDVPVEWLAGAVVALGHAAGEAVHAGRMTLSEATAALARSALRVCGVDPATTADPSAGT
ncbi:TetR/AcrR family transcriptional regulator [Saccharothrix variisporea]|uniref:TetR family transcriptional regulator n=1 Tax=Saccharothrix variisporea TaxID=543527 RepID=A0A495X1Y9_9PSEU|nr:TetR/AcrR family transcriptional regulator [Saccharothrix variisporea]RKT67214.1 TetR family transcriptional regulator [Saccharothrix variisporea]